MIKRYECDCYAGTVWMEEKALGDYVKYEDHLAEIEKYKELAKAAWEIGYAAAKADYERGD